MEQEQAERFDEFTAGFPPVKPSDYLHNRGTDKVIEDLGQFAVDAAKQRCDIVLEQAALALEQRASFCGHSAVYEDALMGAARIVRSFKGK